MVPVGPNESINDLGPQGSRCVTEELLVEVQGKGLVAETHTNLVLFDQAESGRDILLLCFRKA